MLVLWPNLELSFQVLAPSIRKLLRLDFAPMDARACCACQSPGPRRLKKRGLVFKAGRTIRNHRIEIWTAEYKD